MEGQNSQILFAYLKNILNEMEIKEIDCVGLPFDPASMEAVLTDHEEGKEENIVLDCLQKGYTYKDKVIRTAMVKVNN